jgi:hypothetical protein
MNLTKEEFIEVFGEKVFDSSFKKACDIRQICLDRITSGNLSMQINLQIPLDLILAITIKDFMDDIKNEPNRNV